MLINVICGFSENEFRISWRSSEVLNQTFVNFDVILSVQCLSD